MQTIELYFIYKQTIIYYNGIEYQQIWVIFIFISKVYADEWGACELVIVFVEENQDNT